MNVRKGQVAMEFIMTYGWAILVVLGAIAALAYFGVFNLGNYIPEKCIFSQGFGCRGALFTSPSASTVNMSVTLSNSLSESITISGASLRYQGQPYVSCSVIPTSLSAGATTEISCADVTGALNGPGVGDTVSVQVNFTYTTTTGVYPKVAEGEISGKVQ